MLKISKMSITGKDNGEEPAMVKIRQEKKTFFLVFGKKSDPVITYYVYHKT